MDIQATYLGGSSVVSLRLVSTLVYVGHSRTELKFAEVLDSVDVWSKGGQEFWKCDSVLM